MDAADDGLGHLLAPRHRLFPVQEPLPLDLPVGERGEVDAGREGAAAAGDGHDADLGVARDRLQRRVQVPDPGHVGAVEDVRPVQDDAPDPALDFDVDGFQLQHCQISRLSMTRLALPSERGSVSGAKTVTWQVSPMFSLILSSAERLSAS